MKARIPITVSLDRELVEEIDEKRGLIPRSRFVEELLRNTKNIEKQEVGGYA